MALQIGILACSAEGAALCYQTICREAPAKMGRFFHPVIMMHTLPFGSYMKAIEADDWDAVAALMESSAKTLEKAGAQIIICPDNTIHQAFDKVRKNKNIIWLHIAAEVASEAKRHKFERLGILGTRFLMEGPIYARALKKFNIQYEIPEESVRVHINELIFEELVNGIFLDQTRDYFEQQINDLKDKGCDAVVLGCTEIPLIVYSHRVSLPTLDSTRILARAAIQTALSAEKE